MFHYVRRVEVGAFNALHNIIVCRVSKGILTRRKILITQNEGSMPVFLGKLYVWIISA